MLELLRVCRTFSSFRFRHAALIAVAWLSALPAVAMPTTVTSSDTGLCDVLVVPSEVDELGDWLLPPDERIGALERPLFSPVAACPSSLLFPDLVVMITNFTSTAFRDLWYVAEPETSLTNEDGLVNGLRAFKIDAVGINLPLIFESAAVDGIFAPGETWHFIIDDYINSLGLSPAALGQVGVPVFPLGKYSSGSIIAVPIPEPASAGLLGLGLLALSVARRRAGA